MNSERVREIWAESRGLKEEFFGRHAADVADVASRITASLASGGKLLLFGNGGSAADAQHIAAELVGRFRREREPLPALALTTDTSALTALANDFGFDRIFEHQVKALGRSGDFALALSTSGRSPNVVKAAEAARNMGIGVAGLLGGDGGELAALCEPALIVPHTFSARIQEVHIMVGHILCELVEDALEDSRGGGS